jgi:hypothetical protein
MWSSNFILGPISNSAHIQPKNSLQDASNCARHLFGESPQRRQVSWTWPPCTSPCCLVPGVGAIGEPPECLPRSRFLLIRPRFTSPSSLPSVPRAGRGRVRHGRRSGAPSSVAVLATTSSRRAPNHHRQEFLYLSVRLERCFPHLQLLP